MEKPRVILINPPEGLSTGRVKHPSFYYQPLSLGFLSSPLLKKGIKVKIIDGYAQALLPETIVDRIKEFKADIVGVTGTTPYIKNSYVLIDIIRKACPEIKIVIGGLHATGLSNTNLFKNELLENDNIDHIFIGEAENSFLNFCSGTADSRVIQQKAIEDLDTIDPPAYELFLRPEEYTFLPHLGTKKVMPMVTSRGCVHNCYFCSVTLAQGRRYRMRSSESIVEEIQFLKKKYGIKAITFREGTFTTNKKRVMRFCELLLSKNIGITWNCNTHARELNQEMIKLMKRAGCTNFQLGIEFANDDRLKKYKGNLKIEDVRKAVYLSKKYGISVHGYFLFGMLDETPKTIWETFKLGKKLDMESCVFAIATPYPGTRLFNECVEKNRLITYDWDKYHGHVGAVYNPEKMKAGSLRKYMKYMTWLYYMRPRIIYKRLRLIGSFEEFINHLKAFYRYLLWGH